MKATMLVERVELTYVKIYNDPDYELKFYDSAGSEIHLGIHIYHLQKLSEQIQESLEKHRKRIP